MNPSQPSSANYVALDTCLAAQERVLAKLDSIERRLFVDNGRASIQTMLDRHEQIIRALLWTVSAVIGALLFIGVTAFTSLARRGGP